MNFDKRSVYSAGQNSFSNQYKGKVPINYNLLLRLNCPKEGETDWILEYFMQSIKDPSLLYPLEYALYGDNSIMRLCAMQKLEAAQKISDFVKTNTMHLSTNEAYEFIKNHAFRLQEKGFVVQIPNNLQNSLKQSFRINLSLRNQRIARNKEGSGLLEFDYVVSLGDIEMSMEEFEAIAQSKEHLVKAGNRWIEINPEDAKKVMDLLESNPKTIQETAGFTLEATGVDIETSIAYSGEKYASIIDAISDEEKYIDIKAPSGFCGELRRYQEKGISWLDFLGRFGFGALLADDMGLGKTIQVIAHVLRCLEKNQGPILIIAPTSVLSNWMMEFSRFAPGIKVKIHHGSKRSKDTFKAEAKENDVIITSYALAWRDETEVVSVEWGVVVLDEAQNIKNPNAKQAGIVRRIRAKQRIALTGTPVENRLSELWSIMEFLNPGYLMTWEKFKEKFAKPIESDNDLGLKKALKNAVSPFILRRMKTDKKIIADLPQKIEKNEWCVLTPEQATLYKAVVNSSLAKIDTIEQGRQKMEIFAALTRLKQICNHPANFLKDSRELGDRSGKVTRLRELLATLLANNESCLVFTQYTQMASRLYENLKNEFAVPFFYFHGSLGRSERDLLVDKFQNTRGPKVMVISLKAGGLGLNLTNATNVIHYDRWWNPAVENQATDRTFRIGQKKNVFVYKLTTKGTIEERIEQIIERKKELAESVIGSGESWLSNLSGEKLREIFELQEE